MNLLRYALVLVFGIWAFCSEAVAASITGRVVDKQTGETLIGATIYLPELKIGTTTGFDGSFQLNAVPVGNHRVSVHYISYADYQVSVQIGQASQVVKLEIALESDAEVLQEIVISASQRQDTELSARASERNEMRILNVVSAKAIELSPDVTVAAVLQRVSGVTLERNQSGEGQYAILRGMDKRYNYTLINHVKVPSPDNKHRYLPLDIFPSELLDRIEVTKSLTADMEGDATGGVVDLLMRNAPETRLWQANLSLGYNTRYLEQDFVSNAQRNLALRSPREQNGAAYRATMDDFDTSVGALHQAPALPNGMAGITWGDRFLSKRLGMVVAANFQSFGRGATSYFYEHEMLQTESSVRLTNQAEREYFERANQYGLHTKLDYRLSPNHKLEWYNAYVGVRNDQVRQSSSLNYKLHYEPAAGDLDLALQTRLRTQLQNIFASTLQGTHQWAEHWHAQWSLVASLATNRLPQLTHMNLDNLRENFVDNIYVDADGSTRRWEHNSDRDLASYLQLKRTLQIGSSKNELRTGALIRLKTRTNKLVSYRFKPLNGSQRLGTDFVNLDDIQWTLYTPAGSVGPLDYDATERIAAAFTDWRLSTAQHTFYLGLRAEHTDQGYLMYFPSAGESPEGQQVYLDLLPSAQWRWAFVGKHNLRASYFRSINRPGFFEVVPYQVINEDYDEFGNPELKRARIHNIDLRWEYFPSVSEQLMVGLFFKEIENPIEYAYFTKNYRQYGFGPVNLGTATNLGLEIDLIRYVRQWGIKANYTLTHSQITTPKAYFGTDEFGSYKRFFQSQTRPLVGQAQHVANVSLLFKSTAHKFDAQVAAAYTGEKIVIASHYLNSDTWQAPTFTIDASCEKQIGKNFSLFAKFNNLLNTPKTLFIKTLNTYNDRFPSPPSGDKNTTPVQHDLFGRSILVGLRWRAS